MSEANKFVTHVKKVCAKSGACFYDVVGGQRWNGLGGKGCSNPNCEWTHGLSKEIKKKVLEGTGVCCWQEATGEVCTHETCGCAPTREKADAHAIKIGLVPEGISNYERTAKQREKWIKKMVIELTEEEDAFMEDAFDEMLENDIEAEALFPGMEDGPDEDVPVDWEDVEAEFGAFRLDEVILLFCEKLREMEDSMNVASIQYVPAKKSPLAPKVECLPPIGNVEDLVNDFKIGEKNCWSLVCGY